MLFSRIKKQCYVLIFVHRLLSGKKIKTEADALEAMQIFHDQGVKTVVLSSVDTEQPDKLITLATSVIGRL